MDVLSLYRALTRHKLAVAAVVLATLGGVAYMVFGRPPVYEQASSIVLLQPRSAPSAKDLKKSPSLAKADAFNPYVGDPSLIVGVVTSRLEAEKIRDSFEAKGLDPNYEISAALNYGAARPEFLLTAYGETPEQTTATRKALTKAVVSALKDAQEEQGVVDYYMLGTLPVDPATPPELQSTAAMRSVGAVVAVGGIALFAVLSVLTAFDQARSERFTPTPAPTRAPAPTPAQVPPPAPRRHVTASPEPRPVSRREPRRTGAEAESILAVQSRLEDWVAQAGTDWHVNALESNEHSDHKAPVDALAKGATDATDSRSRFAAAD